MNKYHLLWGKTKDITTDSKDKKILYELLRNCRQSNTEIGRKIGLSKQGVAKELKN